MTLYVFAVLSVINDIKQCSQRFKDVPDLMAVVGM